MALLFEVRNIPGKASVWKWLVRPLEEGNTPDKAFPSWKCLVVEHVLLA
jgi:hypothetical protein